MNYVIYFIFGFLLVYLFYFLTVILQKKRYDKFKDSNQALYFIRKFKLNKDKLNMKKFLNEISILNAFIIATSFTIACIFDSLLLQLLVGFIVVLVLLILGYNFYGKVLKRRDENV